MWSEIEQLVQNGHGNRHLDLLNAIGMLHQRCTAVAGDTLDAAFDEVIAQFATELDPQTAAALAMHVEVESARFPQFSSVLIQKARDTGAAPEGPPIVPAIEGQSLAQMERRSRPRDAASEQNNPIALARKASQVELLQIAALPKLPETLSNVLISRGNRDVLERVLRNPSAAIARSSLTTLAELAPSDRLIKDALAERFDMPEPIVERILPFLPKAQKARLLLSGVPYSADYCAQAVSEAEDETQTVMATGQPIMSLQTCMQALEQGSATVSDVVTLLARETRVAELAAMAAGRLEIALAAAFNALSGRLDHAAVVVLRAIDCDLAAIDEVMQMRRRLGCREARETRSAQLLSQRYTLASARELASAFNDAVQSVPQAPTALPTEAAEAPEALAA